jgi:hypothetical protein
MTIWYIMCSFGTFFQFWYHVPRKIWLPWRRPFFDTSKRKKVFVTEYKFFIVLFLNVQTTGELEDKHLSMFFKYLGKDPSNCCHMNGMSHKSIPNKNRHFCCPVISATRLCESLPMWEAIVYFGQINWILQKYVCHILSYISMVNAVFYTEIKWVGLHFGRFFFTKSSGHPACDW